MARELLSAKALEAAYKRATAEATEKKTRVKVRDGDNLMLVVRPGGGASWLLQYRHAGERKGVTLGAWPDVGLKSARDLAMAAREQVARGVDPVAKRAAQQAKPAAKTATVRQMVTAWLAVQRVSDVYRGNIEAAFRKDVLPAIGAKEPSTVQRADIIEILRELEKREALVMLRRVRMWLKQVYEWALDSEDYPTVTANPVPTGHLRSFMAPATGHFPAITEPGEVPALMRAIRGYGQPVVRTALLFSAYVWQRPSEIREATWSEFDLAAAMWTIPASRMKMRKEHWVPLAPQVVELLRAHQGVVGDDGWVFPGFRYGKSLSESALSAALETMGYKGQHSPHGFRAMARTILVERLGAADAPLEKQLAHEEADKVKRAYNRAEFLAERTAIMRTWADWLDGQR
jgi:integrase